MLYETVDWRQIPHKYLLLLSPTLNKKRKRERVLQQTTTSSITSLLHSPKKKVLWRTMCKRKTENRPSITKMKQIWIAGAAIVHSQFSLLRTYPVFVDRGRIITFCKICYDMFVAYRLSFIFFVINRKDFLFIYLMWEDCH